LGPVRNVELLVSSSRALGYRFLGTSLTVLACSQFMPYKCLLT
jgi:hypothetical protein